MDLLVCDWSFDEGMDMESVTVTQVLTDGTAGHSKTRIFAQQHACAKNAVTLSVLDNATCILGSYIV